MPEPAALGHRGAGIQAVVEGVWYAIGPQLGFDAADSRQLQWMTDATRIMQMIDDWVDRDEDCGKRLTPVLNGDWTLAEVAALYGKTVRNCSTTPACAHRHSRMWSSAFTPTICNWHSGRWAAWRLSPRILRHEQQLPSGA
jgi:hypothetical protein